MDFPNSPTDGQLYTPTNGATYQWSAAGSCWILKPVGQQFLPITGGTMTGDIVLAADANALMEPTTKQQMDAADIAGTRAAMSAEDNLILNGGMQIWQRGTSFSGLTGAAVLTADRWRFGAGAGNTVAVGQSAPIPGGPTTGEPEGTRWLAVSITRSVTASSASWLSQNIEDVRTAAGQTVVLSFDINTAVPTTNTFSVGIVQQFGTGGSPSAAVNPAETFYSTSVSSAWERKTLTIAIPSVLGKTLGTNNDHSLQIYFAIPISYGNQAVQFTNFDLRLGTVAPAQFLRRPIQEEFALCQRYYQSYTYIAIQQYASAAQSVIASLILSTRMRASPSVVLSNITYSNASGTTTSYVDARSLLVQTTATAAGIFNSWFAAALDAEL
jgi:hypothetical protein